MIETALVSPTRDQTGGDIVHKYFSVGTLLKEVQVVHVYAYLVREGDATL